MIITNNLGHFVFLSLFTSQFETRILFYNLLNLPVMLFGDLGIRPKRNVARHLESEEAREDALWTQQDTFAIR